jgi:hypothetical protein
MKNKPSFLLIVTLLIVPVTILDAKPKPCATYTITLNESGKLISLLPEILEKNSCLTVIREPSKTSDKRKAVFLHYKNLLASLKSPEIDKAIGIADTHTLVTCIKRELAEKLNNWKSNAPDLLTTDEESALNPLLTAGQNFSLFPEIDVIGLTQEQIFITYYYKDGKIKTEEVKPGSQVNINKDNLLRIEIQVMSPNIFKLIDEHFLKSSDEMFGVVAKLIAKRNVFRKKYPDGIAITPAIKKEVNDTLNKFVPALNKLFTYFAWRVLGKIHSKKEEFEKNKKDLESKIETANTNLLAAISQLKTDSLKQLAIIAAAASYKPANCADLNCIEEIYKKPIDAIAADREKITRLQKELKDLKKELSDQTNSFNSSEGNIFDVEVLNKVKLFVSSDDKRQYMTHYNAAEDFAFWGVNKLLAINEDEEMNILAHNLTKTQNIRLIEKITAITNDISTGEEAVKKSSGGLAAIPNTDLENIFKAFFEIGIDGILKSVKLFNQVSAIPFNLSAPKWETKLLRTKPTSVEVPYKVDYNIALLKKDGTDSTKVFPADLAYRVNKIYHVRFKAGLYYRC